VTYRVCPTACECHAVRADGVNRTAMTRTREGLLAPGDYVKEDVSGKPVVRSLSGRRFRLNLHR